MSHAWIQFLNGRLNFRHRAGLESVAAVEDFALIGDDRIGLPLPYWEKSAGSKGAI